MSVLSFGSWVTFDTQMKDDLAMECMQTAYDAGCNFFDNAEAYAGGESEAIMGRVITELGWPRWSYVLTTKVFWGIHDAPNMKNTLNRKYLFHAIDGSLERMGVDFVDVLYCHRSDPDTTLEETVWAMSDIVSSGKALYWGTSEWAADEIRGAIEIAERHHLHKPVTEQPQYNLLERKRVEKEYARLYDETGYGATIWSPLASGLLTGKYRDGIPDDSRGALEGYGWLAKRLSDEKTLGQGRGAAPDRRRAGLHDRPAVAGVVHEEPQRVDGDHRRQPRRARSSRTSTPSRSSPSSTPTSWPASTRRQVARSPASSSSSRRSVAATSSSHVLGLVDCWARRRRPHGVDRVVRPRLLRWSPSTVTKRACATTSAWLPRPRLDRPSPSGQTEHGLKIAYGDGHVLEFAVASPDELSTFKASVYEVVLDRR